MLGRLAFSTLRAQQSIRIKGALLPIGTQYQLQILDSNTLPVLHKSDIKPNQLWSMKPFQGDINLPIYRFIDGQYSGKIIKLEQDIWNQQLRRDLIHRLVIFNRNLFKFVLNPTLTLDRASASGRKNRQQKGSGRARQGQRQKSGWFKGVKANGRKVRSLRIAMPAKVRLQALKVTLSSALWDGKIRIIDNEIFQNGRTRELDRLLTQTIGEDGLILMVVGQKVDEGLTQAAKNIERVRVCSAERINVIKLLEARFILITSQAIQELTQFLINRTIKQFSQGKKCQTYTPQKADEESQTEQVKYDPTKPLNLKFKILKDYMQAYESKKSTEELNKFIQDMPKTRYAQNRLNSIKQ